MLKKLAKSKCITAHPFSFFNYRAY